MHKIYALYYVYVLFSAFKLVPFVREQLNRTYVNQYLLNIGYV